MLHKPKYSLYLRVFLVVASSLLLSVSYNYEGWWFLSLVALVPLIFVIDKASGDKEALFLGWLCGSLYTLISTVWIFSFFRINWFSLWLEVEIPSSIISNHLFLGIIWILLVIFLGFYQGLWAYFYRFIDGSFFKKIFIGSALWVTVEYFQAFIFSVILYGPESLLGSHFTFGALGYSLAGHSLLILLASSGGVYLLSFLVILVNILIFYILKEFNNQKRLGVVLVIFLLTVIILSAHLKILEKTDTEKKLAVGVVNTHFDHYSDVQDYKKDQFVVMEKITRESLLAGRYDLMILPESSNFYDELKRRNISISDLLGSTDIALIDSINKEKGKQGSKIVYVKENTGSEIIYEKSLLMPVTEYSPYLVRFITSILGYGSSQKNFDENFSYTRRKADVDYSSFIGGSLCSEIISPDIHRKEAKNSLLLVNLSSHALFGYSKILDYQTKNFARIRAVENNRYFILAGNQTPSLIVSNLGEVLAIGSSNDGFIQGKVKLIEKKSFYGKIGYWFPLMSFITVIIYFLISRPVFIKK